MERLIGESRRLEYMDVCFLDLRCLSCEFQLTVDVSCWSESGNGGSVCEGGWFIRGQMEMEKVVFHFSHLVM